MGSSKEYLERFEEMLQCKYQSQSTRANYMRAVRRFFTYCIGKSETEPVVLLRRYLIHGLQNAEPKTVNLNRAAVVKFFKLVMKIDLSTVDVPRRREPKKMPKTVSQAEIQEAIAKTLNIKHRLELMLFYGCGVRLHELEFLRRKNVMDSRNILWLTTAKGSKERIVPISESIRPLLYEYVKDMEQDELVFGGIDKRSFQKTVSHAFLRIGVHATPHMLRHSFGTHQIMAGKSVFHVAAWMGHSSIKTTQTYIHLSEAELSKSMDLLNGNCANQMDAQ